MLERMDHAAMTASVDLAMGKARSAALFKKPTQDLEDVKLTQFRRGCWG